MAQPFPAEGLARMTTPSPTQDEFVETRSVTLEWKVSGLKTLFEQSKGDVKSKCIKSAPFDSNRWQVFFYPNSGHDQYASLYLACEPTPAEKEKGAMGMFKTRGKGQVTNSSMSVNPSVRDDKTPWSRDGRYRFTFEARSLDRRMTFKQMDALEWHSFSDTARNWGYERSDLYFNNSVVRQADAFLITCKIVSAPTPPSPPLLPRLLIPKDLVNAYASLFNDPDYSDVCFSIQPEGEATGKRPRLLYAAKKVLAGRADYFAAMFSSGFNESSPVSVSVPLPPTGDRNDDMDDFDEADYDSQESDEWDEDDDSIRSQSDTEEAEETLTDEEESDRSSRHRTPRPSTPPSPRLRDEDVAIADGDRTDAPDPATLSGHRRMASETGSFVDATSAPPSTPASPSRGPQPTLLKESSTSDSASRDVPERRRSSSRSSGAADRRKRAPSSSKRKMRQVVITDAAYTTYRALLFWIYTDSITFVPLASTYLVARERAQLQGLPFPYATRRDYIRATTPFANQAATQIPGLCSAKAIYRLADKIGLTELRNRAYDHIVKSLTVENIPYEVFGSFSMRFDEVMRVEVSFLCDKWNEVRASPSMVKVLAGIRTHGRFPGYEDVWSRILPNLEYRPPLVSEEA